MLNINSNIKFIKGVGEKRAEIFNNLGILDVDSLINFYPRRYEDWKSFVTVSQATANTVVSIKATMITPIKENVIRRGLTLYKCNFTDGTNVINVTIFNNKYLANSLELYQDYVLYGKIEKSFTNATMSSPKIEKYKEDISIMPVYHTTEGLNSFTIRRIIKSALDSIDYIPEILPKEIITKYNLISLDDAIRLIHFPSSQQDIENAKKRLIFQELLILQLGLLKLKSNKKSENAYILSKDYTSEFKKLLPFNLTNGQNKAINDCIKDMMGNYPMNRLIQGDVGSGKTAVACALMYTAVKNGYQAALMAPTEILAIQHFESILNLFKESNINVRLLTGSTKAKDKKIIKQELLEGKIDILIGTHAIIQNDVEFSNIALVITDEQHRFGVKQRASLASKGVDVHTLVMSATPIPRTLGLIIYGDLDISTINELPPNRQEISTSVVNTSYHKRIFNFVKDAISRKEQCYIVCSMIDEIENNETSLISAEDFAKQLQENEFKNNRVGLLHGKMKPKEKEAIMDKFSSGEIDILVSTTVIEVGVNVPNATIMIVENAERFGLSQLHQLRGRIGRGDKKSYFILVSNSKSKTAVDRLQILKHNSNGFDIADEDLKLRGPGDFFGEKQHGLPKLKIADMLENIDILHCAGECARNILDEDFNLDLQKNNSLCKCISDMFRNLEY